MRRIIERNLFGIIALTLLCLLACPSVVEAQDSIGGGLFGRPGSLRNGTSDPAACQPAGQNVFINRNSTPVLKICTSANVWSGVLSSASATVSDSIFIVEDNADGTKEFRFEVSSVTAGQQRVVTVPDSNTTLPVFAQVITFAGPTAARTVTLPDANITVARTDAAQTFTGVQTFSSAPVINAVTVGAWTAVAYNAADFTASAGTWTVDVGDLTSFKWTLINKTMTVAFDIINTDVSATPTFLQILIPGGYTAATTIYGTCYTLDNGGTAAAGLVQVNGADTKIYISEFGSVWQTTAADNTRVRGHITFEVQ